MGRLAVTHGCGGEQPTQGRLSDARPGDAAGAPVDQVEDPGEQGGSACRRIAGGDAGEEKAGERELPIGGVGGGAQACDGRLHVGCTHQGADARHHGALGGEGWVGEGDHEVAIGADQEELPQQLALAECVVDGQADQVPDEPDPGAEDGVTPDGLAGLLHEPAQRHRGGEVGGDPVAPGPQCAAQRVPQQGQLQRTPSSRPAVPCGLP